MKKLCLLTIAFSFTCVFAPSTFAQTCLPGGFCGATATPQADYWRIAPAEQNQEEVRLATQNSVNQAARNADLAKLTDAEKKKQKCNQQLLDIDATVAACKVIENGTAAALANACPDLTYSGSYTGPLGQGGRFGSVTVGVNYNTNCEARRGFDLGARIAACDFSGAKMKAAVGSCE